MVLVTSSSLLWILDQRPSRGNLVFPVHLKFILLIKSPHGRKEDSRMDERLQERCYTHQDRVKSNEESLVLHDRVPPSSGKFSNSIYASYQDESVDCYQGDGKDAECTSTPRVDGFPGQRRW